MNLSSLTSAWRVFKAGESVADPARWKQGQVTANMVTVLLAAVVALLKGLGYDMHVDDQTLAAVGAGAFALVNWVLTVATTDKIGIFGQRRVVDAPVARSPGDAAAGGNQHAASPVGSEPAIAPAPGALRPAPDGQQDEGGYLRG